IFYDNLVAGSKRPKRQGSKAHSEKQQEAFERLTTTISSLEEQYDPVWGSVVKKTLKRVYPGFAESYYGYRSFSDLLADAKRQGLIELEEGEGGNFKIRTVAAA